jgi:uncharacterized membrane protein
MDRLKGAGGGLVKALGDRALGGVENKVSDLTDRFDSVAGGGPFKKAVENKVEGKSPVTGALKGMASEVKDKIPGLGGGGSKKGGGDATKSTNIIESIDVGVPIEVAYNQWTEFGSFPSFMKKVENVEAAEENKLKFKAQIVWSHRTWEATILEQVPDERIVWRSQGEKGHVDGAVTFHELGPSLTRILLVLEYYPQGLFEKTGNIWRAQGRRARAELKHFRRHVMTRTILEADEHEGWRGTIHDGEVEISHEDALEQEQQERDEDQYDEPEDEFDEEGDEDEQSDEEPDDEYDEPEDEYDEADEDEEGDEGEEPEDEYDEEEQDDEYEDERSHRRAS